MRKVAVLTGSRGDYSIYSSVLDAIDKRQDIRYELIVTGMHLARRFGHTIDEIIKDRRIIGARVNMLKYKDTLSDMVKNTGVGVIGITGAIERIRPDVILVLGDRGEQLAAAMAGAHMNIPVAHLHGGETSGTIDESIRHAITKFAHIHLVATKKSRERIIKMGESQENIYLVGAPGVDSVKTKGNMNRNEVARYLGFNPNEHIILAIYHPVTTEYDHGEGSIKIIAELLIELNKQTIWIYTNSDAGHLRMMGMLYSIIKKAHREARIKIHRSLAHDTFLSIIKQCDLVVGNSSSGIIEAPSCPTPYVLIGTRQYGREKAESILEAGYDRDDILHRIETALYDDRFKETVKNCERPYDPFNDAKAGERVADILATFKITPQLLQKRIGY